MSVPFWYCTATLAQQCSSQRGPRGATRTLVTKAVAVFSFRFFASSRGLASRSLWHWLRMGMGMGTGKEFGKIEQLSPRMLIHTHIHKQRTQAHTGARVHKHPQTRPKVHSFETKLETQFPQHISQQRLPNSPFHYKAPSSSLQPVPQINCRRVLVPKPKPGSYIPSQVTHSCAIVNSRQWLHFSSLLSVFFLLKVF